MNQSRLPNQQSIIRAPEPVDNEQPSESQNGLVLVNSLRPFPMRTSAISIIPVDSNMFQHTPGVQLYRFPAIMNQGEHLDQLLLPITNSNRESNHLEAGTVTWNERTSNSVEERNFTGKERVTRGPSLPLNRATQQQSKRIQVNSKETQDRFVQVDRDIQGFRYAGTDAIMKSYSGFRRNSIEKEISAVNGQEIVKKDLNTYGNIKHKGYNSSSSGTSEVIDEANALGESNQVKVGDLLESELTGDLIEEEVLYDEVYGESENHQTNVETGTQSHGDIENLNNLTGHTLDEFFERNLTVNKRPIGKNNSIKSVTSQSESGLSSTSSLSRNQPMGHENGDGAVMNESDSSTESRMITHEIDEILLKDARQEVKSDHDTKAYGLPCVENPERLDSSSFSDEFSIGFDSSRASTPNGLIKNQKSRKEPNSCILS